MILKRCFLLAGLYTSLFIGIGYNSQVAALGDHSIYFVRHAEKQKGKDPDLTPAGHCRAQFYAKFFSKTKLDRLFASKYRRNQQTAAPVSAEQQLTALSFDPKKQQDFAKQLAAISGTSLVVAHNHLSEIIRALGGQYEGNIDHSEYRYIFMLDLRDGKLVQQRQFVGPYFSDGCTATP